MDPFHVVRLPATPWTDAAGGSSRPSTATAATRAIRSTRPDGPCTPASTCSPPSRRNRLPALFAVDEHVEVEATWGVYQRMITAYRDPDRTRGRGVMTSLIDSLSRNVPTVLAELLTLGRTLKKRAADVLAYFDRPGTSNGPTEAINGRLEHLRGSALGFRNLTNYIARCLLETGGVRPPHTPHLAKAKSVWGGLALSCVCAPPRNPPPS